MIHTFEKYSWIGTFILLLVLIGQAAPYVDPSLPGQDGTSGLAFAGTFLTILAINFCKFRRSIPSKAIVANANSSSKRKRLVLDGCRLLLPFPGDNPILEDLYAYLVGCCHSDLLLCYHRRLPWQRCNFCCIPTVRRCLHESRSRWSNIHCLSSERLVQILSRYPHFLSAGQQRRYQLLFWPVHAAFGPLLPRDSAPVLVADLCYRGGCFGYRWSGAPLNHRLELCLSSRLLDCQLHAHPCY